MSFNYLTIRSCFFVAGTSILICHLHKLITMAPPICWLLPLVHTQEMSQILVLFILFLPTWTCFSACLYLQAKPEGLIGGALRHCSKLRGVYVHRESELFVGAGGLFFPFVESFRNQKSGWFWRKKETDLVKWLWGLIQDQFLEYGRRKNRNWDRGKEQKCAKY